MLVLGRAWRATGQPAKAIEVLSAVSRNSTEQSRASTEKEAAELEQLAQFSPPDPVSSWRVGKQLISANEIDRARQVFEHLVAELPDRPEGYCGLSQITFLRTDLRRPRVRLNRSHRTLHEGLGLALQSSRRPTSSWGRSCETQAGVASNSPVG